MADERNTHPEEEIPQSNAARRLKGLGIDPNASPADAVEVAPVGFWENFWYHHKWKTIICVSLVILFVICTMQMCTQNSYDLYVMYAGPGYMTPNETLSVQSAFGQLVPRTEDTAQKEVMVSVMNYMNAEQIAEKKALAEEQGVEGFYVDLHGNASELERFQMEVVAGNSVIYLLDPLLYESVKEAGGLLPLGEVLSEIPAAAIDEYGIRLGETDLYESISALQNLPEETVLCIRKISTMSVFKGQKKSEEIHAQHTALFKSLVTFESAE